MQKGIAILSEMQSLLSVPVRKRIACLSGKNRQLSSALKAMRQIEV